MAKWKQERYRLRRQHGWKAKPGYKIFVANRGDLRLDIPRDWPMTMHTDPNSGQTTFTFTNRPTPDDDCRLQVTVFTLPAGIEFSRLPLEQMFEETSRGSEGDQELLGRSLTALELRHNLELAWSELRLIDPGEHREARSRICLARCPTVAALLTLDYWPEDAERFLPVWENILDSLRLGEYIADPTRGPVQ